jgi:hypothetical protein
MITITGNRILTRSCSQYWVAIERGAPGQSTAAFSTVVVRQFLYQSQTIDHVKSALPVVGDDHQYTLVLAQQRLHRLDCGQVQVVGRL